MCRSKHKSPPPTDLLPGISFCDGRRKLLARLTIMAATLLLAVHTIPALADTCAQSSEEAQTQQIRIPGHASNHSIIGKGRAYFFSAPNSACISKQLFVVPGDIVIAYADYQAFTYVLYIHPKTGAQTDGWLQSARLKPNGTGVAPAHNVTE